MSWLDQFLSAYNSVQSNGAALPQRSVLNFTDDMTVTDDAANARTNIASAAAELGEAIEVVSPRGGTLDDWPTLIGRANALAYKGAIILTGGIYLCKTKVALVSGTTLIGGPGVSVVCSLGTAGDVTNAPFTINGGAAGSTTLAATPTLGTSSLSLTGNVGGALVVGASVEPVKASGLRGLVYIVRAVSGSGPYAVTVDRPLRMSFASGDTVNVYAANVAPTDITILGNRMRISGTFSRALEMSPARRCLVSKLVIDASASKTTDLTIAFDIGGFSNRIVGCEVDGGNVKDLGIALESNESSTIEDCIVLRTSACGVLLDDCIDCEARGCVASAGFGAAASGFQVTADGSTLGSLACRVRGCTATTNGQYGFLIGNGSSQCSFVDCVATGNGAGGFFADGTGSGYGNVFTACISRGNAPSQFTIGVGCLGLRLIGCEGDRSTGFNPGWNINASCTMDGCFTATGVIAEGDTGVLVSGAGTVVTMTNCRITPYYGYALSVGAGARVVAVGCTFAATDATNPTVTIANTGEVDFSNVVVGTVANAGTGVTVAVGGIFRRSGLFDASLYTTPIVAPAGAFLNVGVVVLNGAVAVNYAFPVLATDTITLTRQIAGGVGGLQPTYVITPGVQVAVTGTAGDLAQYQIAIGP